MKTRLNILFEDEHLIVINKPPGLPTIVERFSSDSKNLTGILCDIYGKIYTIHRLDKDTSGVICFAKTAEAHSAICTMFENRLVEKEYLAIVKGKMNQQSGIIDAALAENRSRPGTMMVSHKGKVARSEFMVLENFQNAALVKVKTYMGRTHQVRVHLKHLGHPLLVDEKYSGLNAFYISDFIGGYKIKDGETPRPTIDRLTLHAFSLAFTHPFKNESMRIVAPMPHDFEVVLKLLRKYNR
ncbi:MAG: RluA family pseudouridine synthase [Chitinophagales bacterium]|nr:RluA family pseudouridine synthase [Chitinophagales bacterium]MDW8273120.1 RluA family pseudouridine synthase [Chitinophagales bacterium]